MTEQELQEWFGRRLWSRMRQTLRECKTRGQRMHLLQEFRYATWRRFPQRGICMSNVASLPLSLRRQMRAEGKAHSIAT